MKLEIALCWVARAWGVASSVLLFMFAFGGREHLRFTVHEAVAFLFFPVGVVAGFVLAWRRELVGGMVSVGSLALFYVCLFAFAGRVPMTPWFLVFAAPGFLHIASGMIAGCAEKSAQNGALG